MTKEWQPRSNNLSGLERQASDVNAESRESGEKGTHELPSQLAPNLEWLTVAPIEESCSRTTSESRQHAERRTHLCHELAILSLFGSRRETSERLFDLSAYAHDVKDTSLLEDLASVS